MGKSALKRWNLIVGCVFLTGALVAGISAYRAGTFTPLSDLGLVICAAGIVLGLVKLRCPFCHHFLGILSDGYSFCPWCGDRLTGSDGV
ncbi:hypothetical protein [Pseudoflavonifractor capillosus]|uniref:Uncharacterized protein n=1 Tax=Pseudoflavonifractor capillosus TaxID=106588 RepID=A0A921SST6_9FIRM|nr:hypothetical protein [Pseudoflavonifractor capillosus]HJG86946.1 hypothetical protein [Pseudoflavonifractor capillosus]